MLWNEDRRFYSFFAELLGDPFCRSLSRFIVIHADEHIGYVRIVLQHLKQYPVRHRAGRRIAVLLPVLLVHRDEREHIYRRFKQAEILALAVPVEAVFGFAAVGIALEAAFAARAAHIRMSRNALAIEANEHSVMELCGFVDHLLSGKGVHHIAVESAPCQEISIHPTHIVVARGKLKRLFRLDFNGSGCDRRTSRAFKQKLHGFRVGLIIEPANEVYRIAALSVVLMKPKVSAYSYLLRAIEPFVLRAGALESFSTQAEELAEICLTSPLLLLVGEIDVFCWHKGVLSCDFVRIGMVLTCFFVIDPDI